MGDLPMVVAVSVGFLLLKQKNKIIPAEHACSRMKSVSGIEVS